MAISYPLTFPTHTGVKSCDLRIERAHIVGRSLSNAQVVSKLPLDRWAGTITLPPLSNSQAQVWYGWLDSLDGAIGTFTMPHPDYTSIQGNATNNTGRIKGASQTGSSILTDGWSNNVTNLFSAGDLISYGSRLKRVVAAVNSNGSGEATLEIAPPDYVAASDNAIITTVSPVGTFRLTDGTYNSSSNHNKVHTISFAIEEVPQS